MTNRALGRRRSRHASTLTLGAGALVVGAACGEAAPEASSTEQSAVTSCPVGFHLVCESGCDPPPCTKPICSCESKDDACVGRPDGTACNDYNACTQASSCQASKCIGSSPVVCQAADECHVPGVCGALTGACTTPAAPDGTVQLGGLRRGRVPRGSHHFRFVGRAALQRHPAHGRHVRVRGLVG